MPPTGWNEYFTPSVDFEVVSCKGGNKGRLLKLSLGPTAVAVVVIQKEARTELGDGRVPGRMTGEGACRGTGCSAQAEICRGEAGSENQKESIVE